MEKDQIAPVLLVRPGQESNPLLELISEIDRLLREKEMRLRNVRREASKYVIEAVGRDSCRLDMVTKNMTIQVIQQSYEVGTERTALRRDTVPDGAELHPGLDLAAAPERRSLTLQRAGCCFTIVDPWLLLCYTD